MDTKQIQEQTTPIMQNNDNVIAKPIDSPLKDDNILRIYYNPKPSVRICLKFNSEQFQQKSINDLIIKCLKVLKEDYFLVNTCNSQAYSLFKATKTGCKKQVAQIQKTSCVKDYPYRRLFLQSSSKSICSLISTDYDLNKKNKEIKKPFNIGSCCFLFNTQSL